MSSESLTQKALEQHDKTNPKLALNKNNAVNGKDVFNSTKAVSRLLSRSDSYKSNTSSLAKTRSRLYSRTDSNRSLPNGYSSDIGTSSRHSMYTPRPTAGLSVFRLLAAARAWKRLMQRNLEIPEKPKVAMENTYRLAPDLQQKFHPKKVEVMIDDVLGRYLKLFKYTPEASKQMCLTISSEVKSRVKGMGFPRYKFVCFVFIFQNKGQGSEICSRSLWSPETDSFATGTFRNEQFVCVVNVHAVYFE